ncbi:MAG: energy-coupling factor transporter ATPase [Thermofilaceae archaeon]
MKAVRVEDVWWRYVGRSDYALKGAGLEVEKGEFFAIMGHSGAGKTTLALTISGIIPQRIPGEFKGKVEIFGENTLSSDVTELARKVAIVFEDPEIQFVMSTVEDEIVLALEPLGLHRDDIKDRITWSLELVGLSNDFLGRSPLQLSGGEKQRVAIATALAREPEVLVLDEPTSDLDPVGKEEVVSAIRRLRDELDTTIILIDHESEHVAEFADRVAVLGNGRVVMEGDPGSILTRFSELRENGVYPPEAAEIAAKLGLNSNMYRFEQVAQTLKDLVKGVRKSEKMEDKQLREVLLKCIDVHYAYPNGVKALRGASLEVHSGELIALVGPNGSGKTTLAKAMCGLLQPTSGKIELLGKKLDEYDRLQLSSLVSYVYQNPDHQIFNKTVHEEIAFGLRLRKLSDEEIKRRVEEALKLFGLTGLENEHPFFLSKGEKRRLALASVYALNPKVLIVDEPTTGQDMKFSETLASMLRKLADEGRAVVVITHSVPLFARYANRLVVMKNGLVIAEGSPREVMLSKSAEEGRLVMPQTLRLYLKLGLDLSSAPLSVEEFLQTIIV